MAMRSGTVTLLAVLSLVACGDAPESAPLSSAQVTTTAVPQRFSLYTHCGVESAIIDGHWWHVTSPLYGAGGQGSGPPEEWGDPLQHGTLAVTSTSLAVFRAGPLRVELAPAVTDEPVRICR